MNMQTLPWLAPFFLPPYALGKERKNVRNELELNLDPFALQVTALTTRLGQTNKVFSEHCSLSLCYV